MSSQMTEKLRAAFGRFQARDLAGAEQLCGEVLKEAPRNPDALHLLGVVRLMKGDADEAASLVETALKGNPRDATMLEHLGVARLALREYEAAETAFREALALGAAHGVLYMRLGMALASQGKLPDAVAALREAADRSPGDPDVHVNLGNTLAEEGRLDEALACYNTVLALQPDHPAAHFNLGNLHRNAGRLEAAVASFKRTLVVAPDDPDTHNNLGLVYERQQRLDDAASCYRQVLALSPDHIHALNNLGNVLRAQGRLDEAVASYEKAVATSPHHFDAYINLGITRAEQGRFADAQALYDKVLHLDPRNFEAHYNTGGLKKMQGRPADSIIHFRRAVNAAPNRIIAHTELGSAYRQVGDLDSAIACFRKAGELDSERAETHHELAETLKLQGRLDEAIDSYARALEIKPGLIQATGGLAHLRQHVCRWEGIEGLWRQVQETIAAGTAGKVSPFSVLSMPASAAEQLACARAWAQRELAASAVSRLRPAFELSSPSPRSRLRVGYLSWGFHRHATAYLTAELFELHDRERVEIFAYDYGPDDKSAIRARLQDACEHFADVSQESYVATAKRIHADGVDILVDLTGYTLGARTQILALRPAPVQVNWLGYPGTMGADYIDYIVADPYIIPAGEERHYAEKVVRLPDCYQINDRRREISDRVPTREECGLPGKGFVFCCFNQAYKILPDVFALWMRILQAVPGSVLWLVESNPWQAKNLRVAAAAAGVAAERLVFAARKPLSEYLVQYRLADLALDTFPYTSHTTASDALWMGCPLVTRAGETFASRVAGSILNNAGLPDLITGNFTDYQRVAIDLAKAPQKLGDIRHRLRANRDTCALFDTPRFVRNLESAYGAMFSAFVNAKR